MERTGSEDLFGFHADTNLPGDSIKMTNHCLGLNNSLKYCRNSNLVK